MSEKKIIEIRADKSKFKQDIKEAEAEGARAARAIATNIRRSVEFGLYMIDAMGQGIDTVMRLMIETGLRSIEFFVALFAAQDIASLGILGVARLGAQAAAITLMMFQIAALRRGQAEASQNLGSAANALRIITY